MCNFGNEKLNGGPGALAEANGVAILGGCSTTPALIHDAFAYGCFTPSSDSCGSSNSSSNNTNKHSGETGLEHIDIALSPGNKLPRGVATISSVVSYVGSLPFTSQILAGRVFAFKFL